MKKIIATGVGKLKNIAVGWGKRLGFLKVENAEITMSERRMDICKKCPIVKESKILKIVNGNAHFEKVLKCGKCGCPIWEKTIVFNEKCPLGKW